MKASELRIENLFIEEYSSTIIKVIGLEKNKITFSGVFVDKWQAKPIALTEEWLIKFGFYKNDELFTIEWNEFSFSIFDFDNGKFAINNSFNYVDINYVHQLQNLYFALTGEELIINN